MNLIKSPSELTLDSVDLSSLVARYKKLRLTSTRLGNLFVKRLTRDMLYEGAKKIGILHKGQIVFDNESQTSVLMDYCIYNIYRQGRNTIERYLLESPPATDSLEIECLKTMQDAKYSVIVIESNQPGVGCYVRNLVTGTSQLLVDIGLSRSAPPNSFMATRLFDYGDFIVTGGAALPLGTSVSEEVNEWDSELRATLNVKDFDPANTIRGCIESGSSLHVRYDQASANAKASHRIEGYRTMEPATVRSLKVEPRNSSLEMMNVRCRCRSGKMYRNCCGKK